MSWRPSAVVANTIFGVGAAIAAGTPQVPRQAASLNALIDLPLAVSPVVVGLALILVYGKTAGSAAGWRSTAIQIIFCAPGMVLATIFVSLPLVVRAVVPVLVEMGDEQEQAARTLGAGTLADLPPHHHSRHPGRVGLRRGALPGPRPGRVRRDRRRLGPADRQDPDADRSSSRSASRTSTSVGATPRRSCSPSSRSSPCS